MFCKFDPFATKHGHHLFLLLQRQTHHVDFTTIRKQERILLDNKGGFSKAFLGESKYLRRKRFQSKTNGVQGTNRADSQSTLILSCLNVFSRLIQCSISQKYYGMCLTRRPACIDAWCLLNVCLAFRRFFPLTQGFLEKRFIVLLFWKAFMPAIYHVEWHIAWLEVVGTNNVKRTYVR